MVVENVADGNGNGTISARQAARAAPDGHGFLMATNSTHAAVVHLLRDPGYDPVRDFLPVTLTSLAPLVLMVRAHPQTSAPPTGKGRQRAQTRQLPQVRNLDCLFISFTCQGIGDRSR